MRCLCLLVLFLLWISLVVAATAPVAAVSVTRLDLDNVADDDDEDELADATDEDELFFLLGLEEEGAEGFQEFEQEEQDEDGDEEDEEEELEGAGILSMKSSMPAAPNPNVAATQKQYAAKEKQISSSSNAALSKLGRENLKNKLSIWKPSSEREAKTLELEKQKNIVKSKTDMARYKNRVETKDSIKAQGGTGKELPPPKADLLKSYHGDRANMRARRMMDQGKATDFSSAQAAAAKKEKDKSGFAPVASFKGPTILPPNKQE